MPEKKITALLIALSICLFSYVGSSARLVDEGQLLAAVRGTETKTLLTGYKLVENTNHLVSDLSYHDEGKTCFLTLVVFKNTKDVDTSI